jgi:uncharacterized protein YjbI with pentapeptide repeats
MDGEPEMSVEDAESLLRMENLHFLRWAEQHAPDRRQLAGMDLKGLSLAGADLAGANLAGSNLSGAELFGANLCGAKLGGANLTESG